MYAHSPVLCTLVSDMWKTRLAGHSPCTTELKGGTQIIIFIGKFSHYIYIGHPYYHVIEKDLC